MGYVIKLHDFIIQVNGRIFFYQNTYCKHQFIRDRMKVVVYMDVSISVKNKSIDELKKELYDSLVSAVLDSILHGDNTMADGKQIAQFLLDRLDPVTTKEQLLQFMLDLSTKWKLYNPYYVKLKYGFEEQNDDVKIQELKSKLYTFIQPK